MKREDLSDPKVQAFIINAIVNGLTTNIKTLEERKEFSLALCQVINDGDSDAYAVGDEDGILIEDLMGETVGMIMVQEGVLRFQSFLEYENSENTSHSIALARAIMTAIGLAAQWHADSESEPGSLQPIKTTFKVKPASGYIAGGPERGCEWDDDGFGIT